MKLLVLASTFPASQNDATPAFVRDQVVALKRCYPQLDITVVAPHYGTGTADVTQHSDFIEHRFTYFIPRRFQRLAGQGILPSIESNPFLLALVPFLFLFQLVAVLRIARRFKPDFLYAHWFTPQGVNAALVSVLTGIPYVVTSHANDVRVWKSIPFVGRYVVRLLLPRASRITAVSNGTRNRMRDFFSDDEWLDLSKKVAIIPMGVDTESLTAAQVGDSNDFRKLYGYGDEFLVLFLGRLASKKGITYLIDAIAHMRTVGVRLIIAGDGPLRHALERRASETGIRDITDFVGYVTGATKLQYLHMADVVVVPSIETESGDVEGFPVVIMEALAAGKPCIATDASGAGGVIVDGVTGILVPQKDPRALAERITAVMSMSDAEREALGRKASAAAQMLDWSSIARRHYGFLFSRVPS